MLTIHAGMPKTGTTAFQAALTRHETELIAAGILYPAPFRNEEGIAHHALSATFARRDGDERQSASFLSALGGMDAPHILLSSEAFTNALGPARLPAFIAFLEAAARLRPVRLVIALRRIDSFIESMYLHSVKAGDAVGGFPGYVARRRRWMAELFSGLAEIRARFGGDAVTTVKYRRGGDFASELCAALGIPDALVRPEAELSSNPRLGLKAEIVLLHLDELAGVLGGPVERFALVRDIENGLLTFPDDVYDYSILSGDLAGALHADAVAAAVATGEIAYVEYFGADTIPPRVPVSLGQEHLSDADIARLARHLKRDVIVGA